MYCNKVTVIGSCMVDFVSYAPRLPQAGETVRANTFATSFGGKGANQCVASARLGAKSTLVAKVGSDLWGEKYIQNLRDNEIDTTYVSMSQNSSTGIAQIVVAESGENQIVITPGANEELCVNDIEKARTVIESADVLICQLETSPEVAIKAMELCKSVSILNGAPGLVDYPPELLTLPTIFCVNETEATVFSGVTVKTIRDAETAALALVKKGCNVVIITLGELGAVFLSNEQQTPIHVQSPSVKCIDSTGAGDCFIGALGYTISKNRAYNLEEAIKTACFVAAASTTKKGTQLSFPGREVLTCLH